MPLLSVPLETLVRFVRPLDEKFSPLKRSSSGEVREAGSSSLGEEHWTDAYALCAFATLRLCVHFLPRPQKREQSNDLSPHDLVHNTRSAARPKECSLPDGGNLT